MQPTLRYPLDDDLSIYTLLYVLYQARHTTAVTVSLYTRSLVDEIGVYVETTAESGRMT